MAKTSHLWGFFFYRDTYMIPVLIVPQILMSTKQKCRKRSIGGTLVDLPIFLDN